MTHYIIVKFDKSVIVNDLLEPIKKLFNQATDIPGISKVDIYISNTDRENRHDLMIKMELTPEALIEFDNSDIHKNWKLEFGKYIIHKTIFDCD